MVKRKATQKQLKARANFKKNIAKAKLIKKRHPNMKFSSAIKIAYGKKKEPKKGKKKAKRKVKRKAKK